VGPQRKGQAPWLQQSFSNISGKAATQVHQETVSQVFLLVARIRQYPALEIVAFRMAQASTVQSVSPLSRLLAD
jgi:hypothetical protein